MNDRRAQDDLLSDILAEPDPAGLREALLSQTLRLVKRRRLFRKARRAASVFAVLGGLVFILWRLVGPGSAHHTAQTPYILVRTQPLSERVLVATRPLARARLIVSSSTVASVSTKAEARAFQEIDDATLLSLAAPNAAVLVRLGPHSAELVFVPPKVAEQPAGVE